MKLPSKSRPILSEEEVFLKLRAIGQEQLLQQWPHLLQEQKESLIRQISQLDSALFNRQREALLQPKISQIIQFVPFEHYSPCGDSKNENLGMQLVKEGKVALVVLAGGQGSRLRCKGPKGSLEVTRTKRKSLFQLLAEKVKAASIQAGRPLEVAFMTSPLTHVATQTYFTEHIFFNLDPAQVTFFYQRMWPFLNFQNNLFLEEPGQIARGPNGNGSIFRRLAESGILEKWKNMGIEMVHVIPIDNPLAAPFNYELFGYHAQSGADISLVATHKRDPLEKVGVLAMKDKKTQIIEYFELPEAERAAENPEGRLKFGVGNVGIYCFSIPFIEQVSRIALPLHFAKKVVKELIPDGKVLFPEEPNAWKFEEFIFDALPFAESVKALLFPREQCFAPLKNLKGEDSIDTVSEALLAFDRNVFEKITGKAPPPHAEFELAPQFYYPTTELLNKWRGKAFPNENYIDE